MTIDVMTQSERPIDPRAVRRLYDGERWWPERKAAGIAQVLERGPAVGAWLDGDLVGFVRAGYSFSRQRVAHRRPTAPVLPGGY